MTTSKITQRAPLPRSYSILRGEQINMYSLDTANRKLSNTVEEKFQDKKNTDPIKKPSQQKIIGGLTGRVF